MSIQNYIAQALSGGSPGGESIASAEAEQILRMAIDEGLTPEQLGQMAGLSGQEVRDYLQYNPSALGNMFLSASQPSTGSRFNGSTAGITRNPNAPDPSRSNFSPLHMETIQSLTNQQTALQNNLFNNPNIVMPDGSTQSVSFGNMPDYEAYVRNNPDLYQDFLNNQHLHGIQDIKTYGQLHYTQYGQSEGRTMPTGSAEQLGYMQPTVKMQLSPQEQAIYDANQRSRGILANTAENSLGRVQASFNKELDGSSLYDPSQFLDQSKLTARTVSPTVGGMESVRNAMIDRYQPLFDRRRDNLKNDLMVQGHNPGNESWNNQFDDLNRAENDFYLGAMMNAGQEQQRLFNMEGMQRQGDLQEAQTGYDMGQNYRQNQINEILTARQIPLNEYNALMTGTQMGLPQMAPYSGGQIQGPNYAGAAQEQYNRNFTDSYMDQQQKNGLTQGLFQLGGSVLGAGGWGGLFSK